MNTAHLITQLLEIEKAVGKIDPARIRAMVFEAEESILQIEQQMIDLLLENDSLQQRLDNRQRPSLAELPEPRVPEKFFIN
jgi:hypothetical protein